MDIIDFILHIDKYLSDLIQSYGIGVYLLLFLIIFLETGLVITPFLPGDSLIFAAGAFAGKGDLNIFLLFFILGFAAILGDSLNYWIGNFFGVKVFEKNILFKREHLEKTQEFYKKHGSKTIVIARFVPIVRTFAPFIAGVGKMDYTKFLTYNIIGGIIWVGLFLFAGFFFGGIPAVKENFTIAILVIIFISILPIIFEFVRHKLKKNKSLANI